MTGRKQTFPSAKQRSTTARSPLIVPLAKLAVSESQSLPAEYHSEREREQELEVHGCCGGPPAIWLEKQRGYA
jgi:hypothetical protein